MTDTMMLAIIIGFLVGWWVVDDFAVAHGWWFHGGALGELEREDFKQRQVTP